MTPDLFWSPEPAAASAESAPWSCTRCSARDCPCGLPSIGELGVTPSARASPKDDRMAHLQSGLVTLGDALCNLNPLDGQGMTMAALQALALHRPPATRAAHGGGPAGPNARR